jgi:hypothetical protein
VATKATTTKGTATTAKMIHGNMWAAYLATDEESRTVR